MADERATIDADKRKVAPMERKDPRTLAEHLGEECARLLLGIQQLDPEYGKPTFALLKKDIYSSAVAAAHYGLLALEQHEPHCINCGAAFGEDGGLSAEQAEPRRSVGPFCRACWPVLEGLLDTP